MPFIAKHKILINLGRYVIVKPSGDLERMNYLTLAVHFFERGLFEVEMSATTRAKVHPN